MTEILNKALDGKHWYFATAIGTKYQIDLNDGNGALYRIYISQSDLDRQGYRVMCELGPDLVRLSPKKELKMKYEETVKKAIEEVAYGIENEGKYDLSGQKFIGLIEMSALSVYEDLYPKDMKKIRSQVVAGLKKDGFKVSFGVWR